jgi:hypothetical protein
VLALRADDGHEIARVRFEVRGLQSPAGRR